MCRSLNGPQESCFCTSRRFNGLPATVSKFGNCILFVGKTAERKTNENEFEKLWSRVSSPLSMLRSQRCRFYEWNCKIVCEECPWNKSAKVIMMFSARSRMLPGRWRKVAEKYSKQFCYRLLLVVDSRRRQSNLFWKKRFVLGQVARKAISK